MNQWLVVAVLFAALVAGADESLRYLAYTT